MDSIIFFLLKKLTRNKYSDPETLAFFPFFLIVVRRYVMLFTFVRQNSGDVFMNTHTESPLTNHSVQCRLLGNHYSVLHKPRFFTRMNGVFQMGENIPGGVE